MSYYSFTLKSRKGDKSISSITVLHFYFYKEDNKIVFCTTV